MKLADIQMRDPYVLPLPKEGRYLLFGTTDKNIWSGPGTGFDCYSSRDLVNWDGPFLHRLADGKLLMLWSTTGKDGAYTMGYAVSDGNILGPWRQSAEAIFAQDGGHGMLFRDFGGCLWMTLHRPNNSPNERPMWVEVTERDGGLAVSRGTEF
jgi:hypothetical protein